MQLCDPAYNLVIFLMLSAVSTVFFLFYKSFSYFQRYRSWKKFERYYALPSIVRSSRAF